MLRLAGVARARAGTGSSWRSRISQREIAPQKAPPHLQLLAASSGGHDANVSGGTLIPRGVDGGGDTATISKKSGTGTPKNIAARNYLDGKKYQHNLLQASIIYASTPPRLYASMPPYFLLSHLRLHASVPLHACTPARFRTLQASMPTCLHVGHTHPRASAPPYLHVSMSTYGKTRLHVSMPPSHTWAYKPLRVHDSTPSCLRAYMGLQASRPQYLSTCVRTSRLHISMVPCPSVGIHVYIPP